MADDTPRALMVVKDKEAWERMKLKDWEVCHLRPDKEEKA